MRMPVVLVSLLLLSSPLTVRSSRADEPLPATLPAEQTAADVLDGKYPYPQSPAVESHDDFTDLAKDRLTPVPAPGVHPRVLISPADLPGLRQRWKGTEAGRAMQATLHKRMAAAFGRPGTPGYDVHEALVAGDVDRARAVIDKNPNLLGTVAHYQFYVPTCLAWSSLDALVNEDGVEGKRAAAALATWARLIRPSIDRDLEQPLADDVFRITAMPGLGDGPPTAVYDGKFRDLLGYHLVGYAYDFAYNFMDDAQRREVRGLIARSTNGRLWMGCRLPHHFRNWNWIEIGLSQPLLSLAIEGEEGYDPRVYKLGVEIARDYCNYGISPTGSATEAVGYMNFGLVWGNPFMVAASRRGDVLLANSHYRAMADWYVHSLQPGGGEYESHGDGGDRAPGIWTLQVWRYFYPTDPRVGLLWQAYARQSKDKPFDGDYHIIEPLLFACDDPPAPADDADGAKLNLPTTFFDPARGSLNARSGWASGAAMVEFECRTDSVGASHEHADRGSFTFSALGRDWAHESFRSVETRYHNSVLIDGLGQGYWPGPGRWIGLNDKGWALTAACDAKSAYDWWWPKQILSEDPHAFVRFKYPRWASYAAESRAFHQLYVNVPVERDDRPSVVAHWKGFGQGDPRMWDEDGWPVRLPFNPVNKAFRTIAFVKGDRPYLLVVDDIRKDDAPRLYQWTMMTGADTAVAKADDADVFLCDANVARDDNGQPKLKKGDRELLVRVLQADQPGDAREYQARDGVHLEMLEKRDYLAPTGGRAWGLDARLVVPSRAVSPNYKVLLFPLRVGDALPKTEWSKSHDAVTVSWEKQVDRFNFAPLGDGRTGVSIDRDGQPTVEVLK